MNDSKIHVKALGQTGYCFEFLNTIIYIDPYLSDSVKEFEDQSMERLFPLLIHPENISNADFVLITHIHRDHCDPDTLLPLSKASPQCSFIGPKVVIEYLLTIGIDSARLIKSPNNWVEISPKICIKSIPSSHPVIESDQQGGWNSVGYLIKFNKKLIYHAGDTSVNAEIIDAINLESKVDVAFIPVNEKNYYRDSGGIIGNMSVREAFKMAEDIGTSKFVPTHWDMFSMNSVYREEIELLYSKETPEFELLFYPEEL